MPALRSIASVSLVLLTGSIAWGPSALAADEAPLVLEAERAGAAMLGFSPDGRRLVSGGTYQNTSYIWDLKTGRPVAPLRGSGDLMKTAAFSPDGRLVVTAGLNLDRSRWEIATWDARTAQKVGELPYNSGWAAAISPDGGTLAVARMARKLGFYSFPQLEPIHEVEVGLADSPEQVLYAPDGSTLAAWQGSTVWVGSARTGEPIRVVNVVGPITSMAFTRDPRRIVVGFKDGTVAVWDLAAGVRAWSAAAHGGKEVRGMAVSADGSLAASGGQDGRAILWDLKTREQIRTFDSKLGVVDSVAFSRDGTRLAVGHAVKSVVWTLPTRPKAEAPKPSARPKAAPRSKGARRPGLPSAGD